MSRPYPNVKSCRLCRYYEIDENFCAVAPDYIGKAHLCQDFALCVEISEEEETEDLTRLNYKQLSQTYLKKLLLFYGKIEVERSISEKIDLWFVPLEPELPQKLGLLGKFSASACLLESYDSDVTNEEINDSLIKILEVHGEFYRASRQQQIELNESDLPSLWILTPTVSEEVLEGLRAQEHKKWESGIYFIAPAFKTAIVAIHQLPQTKETLWLRLLGKGEVQQKAIAEWESLPENHPLKCQKQIIDQLLAEDWEIKKK